MNPFELGMRHYAIGVPRNSNLYKPESAEGAAWDHGWLSAYYERMNP